MKSARVRLRLLSTAVLSPVCGQVDQWRESVCKFCDQSRFASTGLFFLPASALPPSGPLALQPRQDGFSFASTRPTLVVLTQRETFNPNRGVAENSASFALVLGEFQTIASAFSCSVCHGTEWIDSLSSTIVSLSFLLIFAFCSLLASLEVGLPAIASIPFLSLVLGGAHVVGPHHHHLCGRVGFT